MSVLLLKELEAFDDLHRAVQEWVPREVPWKRRSLIASLPWILLLSMHVPAIIAVTAKDNALAATCYVVGAVLLALWTLLSVGLVFEGRTKWFIRAASAWVTIIMLQRAYNLFRT